MTLTIMAGALIRMSGNDKSSKTRRCNSNCDRLKDSWLHVRIMCRGAVSLTTRRPPLKGTFLRQKYRDYLGFYNLNCQLLSLLLNSLSKFEVFEDDSLGCTRDQTISHSGRAMDWPEGLRPTSNCDFV